MPTPHQGEDREHYISRCIPQVLNEGTAKDDKQAAAICYSMWNEHKKSAGQNLEYMDTQVVYFGDAVKALDDNGKVGGYLVRFGNSNARDVQGDYFTKDTYLGPQDGNGAECLFHHSRPVVKGLEKLADHTFEPIKTRRDEIGVWAETVLNMSDQYEKAVFDLVKAGKLGWSSGSASHRVRKSMDGCITCWPIVEGSLTPEPAEPRNKGGILPIKSLDSILEPLKNMTTNNMEHGGALVGEPANKMDTCKNEEAAETQHPPAEHAEEHPHEHPEGQKFLARPTKAMDGKPLGHDALSYAADSIAMVVEYLEACLEKIEPGADVIPTLKEISNSLSDHHEHIAGKMDEHYGEDDGEEKAEHKEEEAEAEAETKNAASILAAADYAAEYAKLSPAEKALADKLASEIQANQRILDARKAVATNHARRLQEGYRLRVG